MSVDSIAIRRLDDDLVSDASDHSVARFEGTVPEGHNECPDIALGEREDVQIDLLLRDG